VSLAFITEIIYVNISVILYAELISKVVTMLPFNRQHLLS